MVAVERELERLRAGAGLLAEASRLLFAANADVEEAMVAVAERALPLLGARTAVDLLDPDGRTRRLTGADFPVSDDVMKEVLLSGRPHLDLAAHLCVPLRARGMTRGALTFAPPAGRVYDDEDVRLATELGLRGGIALDNARLLRDANEAVRVRDDFLAVAGHELRTPLTALKLQLQGLERLAKRGDLNDRVDEIPARMARATAHITRLGKLVDDLLDVSHITAGRLALAPVEGVDLTSIVRSVAGRFSEDLEEMGSALTLDLPVRLLGRWDAPRLDHMIANLLANAIKYGAGQPILVRATSDGVRARLLVRDQGIGIEHDEQLRIFGRFERAPSARRYGGFGLGLWIVHRIVEMSGGSIVVESDPGNGATFLIELPTGA